MENRIPHALFLKGWTFKVDDKTVLKENAEKVLVREYRPEMEGSIFCPECTANLFRSPKDKDVARNGRAAYFAHSRGTDTDCGLRTKKAEGKKYLTEREAMQAIYDKELVIVSGFIKDKPLKIEKEAKEYDASMVEDQEGPKTEVPISRHRGETFSLPSYFQTVRGLCSNFEDNLVKYFYLPDSQHAVQLLDLLTNIENVTETNETPRLYYGRIISSRSAGPNPHNIRMTQLKYNSLGEYKDFYFKATDELQKEKGINDGSKDRVILIYGAVTESGLGLSIENVGWGEFALLPEKYEGLLFPD